MARKRLVKEGENYWDPDTGYIYNKDGMVVMHDAVFRYNPSIPDINLKDCDIVDDAQYRAAKEAEEKYMAQSQVLYNTPLDNPKELYTLARPSTPENKFEYVSWSKREFDLPSRATEHSAGYDFHSPVDDVIYPGETVRFSLEVKVKLKDWTFLMIVPRSSLGFKGTNHVALTNTVGIIDQDYYNNPDNEGVIELKLHNYGPEPFVIKKNDRLVQGIFCRYDVAVNDNATEKRTGGLGSTGK